MGTDAAIVTAEGLSAQRDLTIRERTNNELTLVEMDYISSRVIKIVDSDLNTTNNTINIPLPESGYTIPKSSSGGITLSDLCLRQRFTHTQANDLTPNRSM